MTRCTDNSTVDVSHGLGIPFGGIGTGYSVFGKYGFVKPNFDSIPDRATMDYNGKGPKESFNYLDEPEHKAAYALLLRVDSTTHALQETPVPWVPNSIPARCVRAFAALPKGHFTFALSDPTIAVSMTAFSPMVPHDLRTSTIPVQVYDVTIYNTAATKRTVTLQLRHRDALTVSADKAIFTESTGNMAFACIHGHASESGVSAAFELAADESRTVRLLIAWHYPKFSTPSPAATDTYTRYYATLFADAAAVVDDAKRSADTWLSAIDAWHEAFDVPAPFKRLWFSSLCSAITSTMLSDDPYFFEIETPHRWVCTMDVNVYSSWLYLVNWPEIERMEMNQFLAAIPREGENKGFVWHSLWNDACHYVEEPILLVRLYRDFLWFNDRRWMSDAFGIAVDAANHVMRVGSERDLITSTHGNQSYDVWKMPGISAFVNSAWIYGLNALKRMSEKVNRPADVAGVDIATLAQRAATSFDATLWNAHRQTWNCFYRTADAQPLSVPESVFTDQLFGKWAMLIDSDADTVLPKEKVAASLKTLYTHNLIEDPTRDFRGWVNGLLPGRKAEMTADAYHARVFWICAQLDLGSLLGDAGDESAAIDVFESLERSLHNNHLAVGEWNQSIDERLCTRPLPEETPKDTPRFPPYPRYKCAWEYLIRMIGLKMNETHFVLSPFRTIDFALHDVMLAGTRWTIRVQKNWTRVGIDGQSVDATAPVTIARDRKTATIEFLA
jgi:uncharacterized protein (DUF608 family)